MKILTFSSLYPNSVQPLHGVFVEQRLRHLIADYGVAAEVLAPVPWFPFRNSRFGQYAEMAAIPRRETRHNVSVLHPRYPVIPKVGMSLAPALMQTAMERVIRELQASGRDFDLIDAHYFYPDGVAAVRLGKKFGKPVVVTARGSDINLIARYPAPRRLIRDAALAANGVIAVSKALRGELERIGVPADRTTVIRNGVDLDTFQPTDREEAKRALGLTGPIVLVVSQLKQGKGHRAVIDAMRSIPEATLVLVGGGPLLQSLESHASQTGVADRVRFVGSLPHEELRNYYAAADVSVLASAREGMPNVVLESLACGTPVVATNVGGIPEVVADPVAGRLVGDRTPVVLAEAVRTLLVERSSPAEVRSWAERFDWRDTSRGQMKVFEEALG